MAVTRTPHKLNLASGANAWTNQPAGLTEFLGLTHHRLKAELTDCDRCRLVARVSTAGAAGATLKAQYSTDESAWSDLTGAVAIDSTGTKATAWADVPAGARGDVFVRLVGSGGNGTADPVIGSVMLEAR